MRKIKLLFLICFLNFFLISCQTVKEKTDAIVEKENKKLSQYIGKSSDKLKNENGNIELVYKTKKYGIPCERKFEVNSRSLVIGFVSIGCF